MNTKTRALVRLSLIMGYIAIISLILSCATIGLGSSQLAQGLLQLEDGVIKVKDQNGDLQPLAGESTFDLVGDLESTDPWQVAGTTLQTNDATKIAEGLSVGDLVHVRGAVLEDDNWLAYSIERAEQETDQTITIVGRVTSVDPWVVNGITLNVTGDTVITGDIKPGTLVKVEILLLEDGTWEVISISPLGDITSTDGCVNVIATIVSVSGNQVQFLGWPTTVTFDDTAKADADNNDNDENDNDEDDILVTLQPGQQVFAVVCVSDDGQLVIVKITILDADDDDGDTGAGGNEKVLVCHKPDKKGGHTISIASPAVPAHLAHGDRLGACP